MSIGTITIHAQNAIAFWISLSLEPGIEIAAFILYSKYFSAMRSTATSNMINAKKLHMMLSATLTFAAAICFEDFKFQFLMRNLMGNLSFLSMKRPI